MDGGRITSAIAGTIIKTAVVVVLVIVIYRTAIAAYDFGFRIYAEPAISQEPGRIISVAVTDEMEAMEIGELLENKGLIRDAKLFYVQEAVSEYKDKIQPGIYDLSTAMTAEEMLSTMGSKAESAEEPESDAKLESESDTVLDQESETETEPEVIEE